MAMAKDEEDGLQLLVDQIQSCINEPSWYHRSRRLLFCLVRVISHVEEEAKKQKAEKRVEQ